MLLSWHKNNLNNLLHPRALFALHLYHGAAQIPSVLGSYPSSFDRTKHRFWNQAIPGFASTRLTRLRFQFTTLRCLGVCGTAIPQSRRTVTKSGNLLASVETSEDGDSDPVIRSIGLIKHGLETTSILPRMVLLP